MTTFDDRERAFENKFAHDEEMTFKIFARTNRLFALWAAELMKMPATQADSYAAEVIEADFREAGNNDVITKVASDLKRHNVHIHPTQLNDQYELCHKQAEKQIASSS